MVFESHNYVHTPREEFQHFDVDGFGEARVNHRGGDTFAPQLACDLFGHGNQRAQCEDRHTVVIAVLDQLGLADRNQAGNILDGRARAHAARVANGYRTVPVHGREEHVGQLVLVLGHHVDNVGDAAEIADVEQAVVGGTVVGREAAAIHAENHRQVLQADIVNDRIESALQEGRVN